MDEGMFHAFVGTDNVVAQEVVVGNGISMLVDEDGHTCYHACVLIRVKGETLLGNDDGETGFMKVSTEREIVMPLHLAEQALDGLHEMVVQAKTRDRLMRMGVDTEGMDLG